MKEGQKFLDEPVFIYPKESPFLDRVLGKIFNAPQPKPILTGYERVELRWMKPDGKGGLVPKC